jgi:glycolate oxidase iron-sulfur subunit
MQTNFTAEQREDPSIAEAEGILRSCVHCGLCTATCPTYLLLGDERDSPRGRIYLIKDMLEGGKPATTEVVTHLDRCLGCLSCMTTCPSGVDYLHLADIARGHIAKTYTRSKLDTANRRLIAETVPKPARFQAALIAARLGRPLAGMVRRAGFKTVAAMLELAPRRWPRRSKVRFPGVAKAEYGRGRRVILMEGCAQKPLRPEINEAAVRLLNRGGVDVVVPPGGGGCCGALQFHMGDHGPAQDLARRNIAVWDRTIDEGPVDAIVVTASGCGTTVKDYGHMLQHDGRFSERGARIGAMTRDISEYLAGVDLGAPTRWSSLRIAYHSACSLQHGQRVTVEPVELLKRAGYAVVSIPEGHICCGSAGTYNMLQPELSAQLKARKIGNIESVKPDIVATGNIGCITQLERGMDIPIVHTLELLDWAYGGPVPRGLEAYRDRVSDVSLAGTAGVEMARKFQRPVQAPVDG